MAYRSVVVVTSGEKLKKLMLKMVLARSVP